MITIPIIGMSPGNSYFKDGVVKALLEKVVKQYGKAVILIADIPAISTYIALGYPENRAWRDKALPQSNNLKNRVERVRKDLGYTSEQVRVIDWENEVENNSHYKSIYGGILDLYNASGIFRESADDATREVLEYSDKEISNLDSAIKIGVHYLLSEIAFMEFAPQYLNAEKVVYVYHRNWPVYEKYIAGDFDQKLKKHLGFEMVKTDL